MGSGKPSKGKKQKRSEDKGGGARKTTSFKNPNRIPLGSNRAKTKKTEAETDNEKSNSKDIKVHPLLSNHATASQQLSFFLDRFQSANGLKLSSLELEPIKDTCMLELSQGLEQDAETLSEHVKAAFGTSWKEVLYEGQILGGIDPGNPAVIVISTSAIRSLELLRGLRPLTKECCGAKLFAKHMKVDDQVSLLKGRVNIASGTPSRIKKLIDMDALGLSRLALIVLDMHTDAKGYSLFTLPQVSVEFWDLYKTNFHQRVVQGDLRISLYGPIPIGTKVTTGVPDE
ncbi:protein CMSS1 [Telopea speciosissima]|uniref:protein CMSS1 n=1 Tax=Telopea speciosissima TaxID=54955 RepID=UPI001CC3F24C|nr:protein CMSS1 [Telopea speciosissima]XP_043720330.1 protein CMSS1 [Telopea speciosissima]